MKIVVIGGSGLIGSKVVSRLREQGHEAVAASPKSGVNTVELLIGDANDAILDATVYIRPFEWACFADFDLDGDVDAYDLNMFQLAYGAGSPRADLNADGSVDASDWSLFTAHYNAGC